MVKYLSLYRGGFVTTGEPAGYSLNHHVQNCSQLSRNLSWGTRPCSYNIYTKLKEETTTERPSFSLRMGIPYLYCLQLTSNLKEIWRFLPWYQCGCSFTQGVYFVTQAWWMLFPFFVLSNGQDSTPTQHYVGQGARKAHSDELLDAPHLTGRSRPFYDIMVWDGRFNNLQKNSCSTYTLWSLLRVCVWSPLGDILWSRKLCKNLLQFFN
jgi:hypothetical protein